ncbi:tetratricopeptide repeat protein [Flavobacterium pedocola]
MTRVITTLVLFICGLAFAQAPSQYEQGMGKALGLWKEGKAAEATAIFERIASVEKNNWLPNYYVALVNTIETFKSKDKTKNPAYLDKAQIALDDATAVSPNNPELMVVQALIYTAWIVQDPMANGMKYSSKTMEQYYKAQALAPENPRVVFSKAEFEIGGAKYWGTDTKPMCAEIERSIGLFAKFKPETPFHPNWGLDRAKEVLTTCGK